MTDEERAEYNRKREIALHNAIVEGDIPPAPNPSENPGYLLRGLLVYAQEVEKESGEEPSARELVECLAHLIDQRDWARLADMALRKLELEKALKLDGFITPPGIVSP